MTLMVLQVCDGKVIVYMSVYMYVILMYKHINCLLSL